MTHFSRLLLFLVSSFFSVVGFAQQEFVLPAISDGTPGEYNSEWMTSVYIIKTNPLDTVTVRRVWVCTPEGGFQVDTENEEAWIMEPDFRGRAIGLTGRQLLNGSNSKLGATALEVEGGEVTVYARVADVQFGLGSEFYPNLAGQGQFIKAIESPLVGPSFIPYLGGCYNTPCEDELYWNFYRNNIGLINPHPDPMTISVIAIPFHVYPGEVVGQVYDDPPEAFTVTVPPYGWRQFRWQSTHTYGDDTWGPIMADAAFVMSFSPDRNDPYYAYASVVFTPDPAAGVSPFNDPMFVPALPGYFPVWEDMESPKAESTVPSVVH